MADKVFVSPGFYTSEKDLSFVTRQVGVTTLGLVGETTQGPAFQPIFVSNYGEFKNFFGGLNPTKVKETRAPKYELPYIAKSYLSQSNQLFVTRILGLSGYNAGLAWAITLIGGVDPTTVISGATGDFSSTTGSYTYNVNGVVDDFTVSGSVYINDLFTDGLLDNALIKLPTLPTNAILNVGMVWKKSGTSFTGSNLKIKKTSASTGGGTVEVEFTDYTGTVDADVDGKVVALLRSRGMYNANEKIDYNITGSTDVSITADATTNAKGDFTLSGTSSGGDNFDYLVSLDRKNKNYLPSVLGKNVDDGKTPLFIEELYGNMFDRLYSEGRVYGINSTLIEYGNTMENYKEKFSPAVTPWVVSELRGTTLLKLFRLWTITDGNTANNTFKISIKNIKLDDKEFDIELRSYYDTDDKPVVLERFVRCSMNPTSINYIAKKIGTLDGEYASKSNYVLIEMEENSNNESAFPAGFLGFPVREYQENSNTSVKNPSVAYKQVYDNNNNSKRKTYLGLSSTIGIDQDFFNYKGVPNAITGMTTTKGFHMDVDANSATIDNLPTVGFDTGNGEFRTELGVKSNDYEKIYSRKFTFAPYGGFDGWDIYRTRRTNTNEYAINGTKGTVGLTNGVFKQLPLSNGDLGLNSDYYAYLEGIWTFNNPESVNINVLATPGIDVFENNNLVEETIDMIEQQRADAVYIVTTPDTDASGDPRSPDDVVSELDNMLDSSYTATYWPWIQINDSENNALVYVPPTRDVVRNIALTDNISFPWFAVAGVQRGDVNANKARFTLTQEQRDTLYAGRINPITTFATEGVKIWGNKTLQIKESALDRLNVRRLLLQARKLISAVSIRLLFEQNDDVVRNQFLSLVNPILTNIRSERGITDFRVVLDNSPESIDRNELCGRIFLKPTRALEFICVEFNIMNTGASFDDI